MTPIAGGGGGLGELALCDSRGHVLRRFVGLAEPTHLAPVEGSRFLVTDRQAGAILELDFDGNVHWSWRCPDTGPRPVAATPLPSGNILFAADQEGAAEINRQGEIVWRTPSPIPGNPVASAIRLADGSTLLVVRDLRRNLFRVPPQGRTATEVPLAIEIRNRNLPRGVALRADGSEFLLWDANWEFAYRATFSATGLRVLGTLHLPRMLDVVPDRGGLAFVGGDDFDAGYWQGGKPTVTFRFVFQPNGVVTAPEAGHFVVAYVRIPDGSWPESRPRVSATPTIQWPRFWLWIAGALVLTGLLHRFSWRRGARGLSETIAPAPQEPTAAVPASVSPASPVVGHLPAHLAVWAACVFALGTALAGYGHYLLMKDFARGWLTFYTLGAVIAALALELWRRRAYRAADPFWQAALVARPEDPAAPSLIIGVAAVVAGGVVLFRWRLAPQHDYTDQVGLWVFLLLTLLGLSVLSKTAPWRRRWLPGWRDAVLVAVPLGVAACTLFYRLSDVPAYMHFDFVFNATSALDLIEGRCSSIWQNGFVPDPVIGLIPEAIGVWLVGPGELGFRLGGALFGLSGIVAAYLFGRCYRDRRTGFLAALFLAGSIPFIHFSRLNANGDAATAGLWALTLFALAIRSGRPGTWILAGLASGYCFYLWPGARAAVAACLVAGCLMTIRSPRVVVRRWSGPLLMAVAFAVWIVPLVPMWLANPVLAFPRVNESMEVFKLSDGLQLDRFRQSFGQPLIDSFGWFFIRPDNSSQGTLSPGCNPVEAVLLAIGLVVALIEGFSVNVLLLAQLVLVFMALGAWGGTPPWYTRMVPTAPIAALLMARTISGALDLLAGTPGRVRRLGATAAAGFVMLVSPAANLRTYVRYETGAWGSCRLGEMVAIGRRLRQLGPRYHDYLVITKRPDWTCDYARRNGRFGELLPLIWELHVTEIRELAAKLPLPSGEPAAVVVPVERIEEDIGLLKQFYPHARVEDIRGFRGEVLGGLAIIESPPGGRRAGPG